jgi:hypothetical protein
MDGSDHTAEDRKLLLEAGAEVRSAAELWALKRERQRRDFEAVRSGKIKSQQLSWFAGRAKKAKLIGSNL